MNTRSRKTKVDSQIGPHVDNDENNVV